MNEEMQNDEFVEALLHLMQKCAEGETDNCDLSFEVGDWRIDCNITFKNPVRIGSEE